MPTCEAGVDRTPGNGRLRSRSINPSSPAHGKKKGIRRAVPWSSIPGMLGSRLAVPCCLFALLTSTPALATARPGPRAAPPPVTTYELFELHSAAIAESKLGDPGDVKLHVLLPPSYVRERARRYPVVYFLPGFDESPRQVDGWLEAFDEGFRAQRGQEFILVALEGRNELGGAFYVNSPATGRWEDFVAIEAVRAVDARYRTIPAAASRGLFGFSMGGFGALHVGLRHPDVFSAVFAHGPGLFAPGGLAEAMASWKSWPNVKAAYGAAFAPDLSLPRPFARIPALSGEPPEAELVARWEAGYGGWPARLDAYLAGPARLRRIRLEVGAWDMFGWILKGTHHLAELMQARGLPVELAERSGGHEIAKAQLSGSVVPFFQANLEGERRTP